MKRILNTHHEDAIPESEPATSGACFGVCANGDHATSRDALHRTPDPVETEKLLVQELNQLSVQEREQVLEEIHGVQCPVEEEVNFVNSRLQILQEEILKIRKRYAYEKAVFVAPQKVKARGFCLMFLRSERFDPRKAAKRMVQYFESKLRLFGFDNLVKPITLECMNEEDVKAVKTGCLQYSKSKDRAGRTVAFLFQKYYEYKEPINMVSKRKCNSFDEVDAIACVCLATHCC
jgi:hypothetical protein